MLPLEGDVSRAAQNAAEHIASQVRRRLAESQRVGVPLRSRRVFCVAAADDCREPDKSEYSMKHHGALTCAERCVNQARWRRSKVTAAAAKKNATYRRTDVRAGFAPL